MSAFLVIEGLDGAGTTTQVERLCASLQDAGRTVLSTREPTDGPLGRVIRRTLAGDRDAPRVESLPWMFAADRADHLHRTVQPALMRGEYVVSDRYVPSSLAYQSLTLPLEQVFALNAAFRVPDLLLFVHAPVEVCLERIQSRNAAREIYEQESQLQRIHAAYERVLAFLAERGDPIVRIDGTGCVESVAAQIRTHIQERGLWPSSSH